MILENSWKLAKSCFHVLRRDKEILLFPLISTILIFITLSTFILSFFISPTIFFWFLFSIPILTFVFTFLGVFFEAAVVGCAIIRLEGGNPKVKDGLKIAADNWKPLLIWSFIGLIIGLILSFMKGFQRRPTVTTHGPLGPPRFPPMKPPLPLKAYSSPYRPYGSKSLIGPEFSIGDILSGILGMAWAVATFFVIPVMIYEKLSPIKAVRRSWEMVKNIWKETLILKLGFGALFTLLGIIGLLPLLVGITIGVTYLQEPVTTEWIGWKVTTNVIVTNASALIVGFLTAIAYWIALGCLEFALKGILRATLYKYSKEVKFKEETTCNYCGAKAPAQSVFCPQCGSKLIVKTAVELPMEREDEFKQLNSFIRSII